MFRLLNNKRVSKSLSSIMLFVILFNNIIFPGRAFALTAGPSQPEYASFDSVNASEMVNMFTGDFSYNIPLMDVDGYPVNISYHASPGMDQEASWVGLGWNINSGAINRGMRGLPDDFNGEEIKREINIADFKAWGVGIGGGAEIVGLDGALAANLSAGIGVTKSNYKGVGLEFYFEPTLSASIGDKTQGSLTAGLGVKASSTDGVDIYPQLGISGQSKTAKSTSSIGYNIGATYNSRAGAMAINNGISISASRGKYSDKTQKSKSGKEFYRGSGIGFGVGSSASIPTSSQGFLPQMMGDMKSQSYSLDFKLGANTCIVAPFGYIRGYYAQNGLSSNDISLKGYGYLNSQNGNREALHDFSREKDGMMYPETPNLPVTNYSYDMFYASAQGMEVAFRPHRNDIGMVHDNPTSESSFGIGVSGEVLLGPDINIGVNVNTHWSDGETGKWEEYNDMHNGAAFTSSSAGYEAAYFKVAGEKTTDDPNFLTSVMNENAVKVKLESVSNQTWRATDVMVDNNPGSAQTISGNFKKSKRAVRNNLVSHLNVLEAASAAVDRSIKDYKQVYASSFNQSTNPNFLSSLVNTSDMYSHYGELAATALNNTYSRLSYANSRTNHISELTVTNTNGGRFVYGLPVYNREQNEVMFNISGQDHVHSDPAAGLIDYNPASDATKGNSRGLDHFYEKNIIPAYAHSYLLTEVLSSDYVDRTGNGPSQDDYGDYTKFNYSYINNYQWRIPYQSNKAIFNQGFLSDNMDDKASYLYGTKDLWMPHSIETKNFIAFFVMGDSPRNDGYGTGGETGGIAGGLSQPYLKEIRLYAKKNFGPNAVTSAIQNSPVMPVKVVHFEYDYSLCPGVPNNNQTTIPGVSEPETSGPSAGLPKNGKLTLKKIYFTHGNSNKGSLTPYLFNYCNGNYNTPADNPTYDPSSIDRWGYYKKNIAGQKNNLDFPYSMQDQAIANTNARAWSLTEIKTPAGSKINVTYEADDYAYVQDKEAAQMYDIIGAANAPGGTPGTTLYDNDYIFINLSAGGANGVPVNTPNAVDIIKQKYFKGLDKIYLKACVQLTSSKYEFVPLYAEIEDILVNTSNSSSYYSFNGTNYYNAIVKIKEVGMNDDNSNKKINPICKAAFQLGRMYLPGVVFPGSQPTGSDHQVIKGLVTLAQDMRSVFSGINRALYNRNIARSFDPARSVAKLYNPNGKKLGGGSRVRKIEIDDNWSLMSTGESSSVYGQEYLYTTQNNGVQISSGVASYEPINGGDENSNRKPVEFSIKRVMAPNDEYFQEEPLGESFFPDALVGYSKVTVRNLERTTENVKKHATGKTEYEFYTAKDFPVLTDRTTLQKQRVKPKLIRSLLKFGSTDKLYMSQGFVIKTNDMHGKPRSQKSFEEDALSPFSGITYFYRTKPGNPNQLDNDVSVIDPANTITNKTIGQTTDIVTDSRSAVNNMWGAGVSANINSASCTYYIPLVFIWPSFSHEKKEFYSITATKTINQYGLIDRVVAFDNNSNVETQNLLYDEETGNVVLTKTNNNYDAPVYSLNYPAYWAYDRMGHAYKNINVSVNGNGFYNGSTAEISGSYFVPGDEILIKVPSGAYTKTWVIQDKENTPNKNYLLTADGNKYYSGTSPSAMQLSIIRSGRRNMLDASMSTVQSLQNPITANKINVTAATQVLSASAVEYSENWQTILGDVKTIPGGQSNCVFTYDAANYARVCNLISAMFDHNLVLNFNTPNPCNSTRSADAYYHCENILTTPRPTLYDIWHNPVFNPGTTPFIPGLPYYQYSGDIIMGGLVYQENASPKFVAPVFKDILETIYTGTPAFGTAGAAAYLWFWVGHGNNSAILYDHLNIYLSKQYAGSDNVNYSSPNLNPGAVYSTIFPQENVCGISLWIPNNLNGSPSSVGTFRWKDVASVRDFSLINHCTSTVPIHFAGYHTGIKFNCYDAAGNYMCEGYAGERIDIPTLNNIHVAAGCMGISDAQTSGAIQANYCGKVVNGIANPYVENIRGNWKPKSSFGYLTDRYSGNDIKTDGYFTAFKPFYDQQSSSPWLPVYDRSFNNNAGVPYDNWQKNEETELVSQHGQVLQTKNVLGIRSSVMYGYNNTLPVAAASNAGYNQIAFDGFEDYGYMSGMECGQLSSNNPNGYIGHFNFYNDGGVMFPSNNIKLTTDAAHTGRYSLSLAKSTAAAPSKITLARKFSSEAPPLTMPVDVDNVPYTVKYKDNAGLFGPYDVPQFPNSVAPKYVLSVWVRELNIASGAAPQAYGLPLLTSPQVNDYGNYAKVNVSLQTPGSGGATPTTQLINTAPPKKSAVINGWQKLEYEFAIPNLLTAGVTRSLLIEMQNISTTRTYLFDDIRVQPFNAQMKAMVYDPLSLRLMAELDDRNFATVYEYDEEGALVRINKETEKGIYTLKETRSGLKK